MMPGRSRIFMTNISIKSRLFIHGRFDVKPDFVKTMSDGDFPEKIAVG